MEYKISGTVIHGDGYGKKIGYPTVNLALSADLEAKPPSRPTDGVYAGTALLLGENFRAGIVIGPGDKIEAHLIGYSGDAYGKDVLLTLERYLREYKKFDSEEELKVQIKKDLEDCLK